MNKVLDNFKGDRVIWIIVLILSVFSLLVVYSSTGTLAFKKQGGNTEYYLFKQMLLLGLGFGLMYVTHLVKFTYYSRISQIALWIAIPLLIVTLGSGSINEASRWLVLPGTGLTFQTSDVAKLALIMYVARLLSKKQNEIKDFKSAFVPIMLPIVVICGLILYANFSTAAILFTTCLILMFIGRVSLKYIFSLLGIGVVFFLIFITILSYMPVQGRLGTWKNRIENFKSDKTEGNYQVEQSKIAIATGGLLGKHPGNSTQRNFLPHPYSDFIFAIIIEEYGLFGGVIITLFYLILFYRCMRIANKTTNTFGTFLVIGCALNLLFQAMINMAVAVNLFPVTGQTLPFVSMGGTSILFTSIAVGIILSVSRDLEEFQNPDVEPKTVEA